MSECMKMYQWLHTCLGLLYVSSWSKNSSDISIYCYPIITLQQLVAILNTFLSTNFGTKAPEHQTSLITSASWDLFWVTSGPQRLLMANSNPGGFKGHWYLLMQIAKWSRYDLIRKQNLVSIDHRCWVINENIISLCLGHFDGAPQVVHPNLVMEVSTFHVGVGPSNKIR